MTRLAEHAVQINPDEFEAHRPSLFKFAIRQLRNEGQAEDAVQETLLAAIKGARQFAGNSSVRTWLTGILKNKIIDQIRKAVRERPSIPESDDDAPDDFDILFDAEGHHAESPPDWGDPDAAFSQSQFFAVLERCMAPRIYLDQRWLGGQRSRRILAQEFAPAA